MDESEIKVGMRFEHVAYSGQYRTVAGIADDGRYIMETRDDRTKSGVRRTRVSAATLRREYQPVSPVVSPSMPTRGGDT